MLWTHNFLAKGNNSELLLIYFCKIKYSLSIFTPLIILNNFKNGEKCVFQMVSQLMSLKVSLSRLSYRHENIVVNDGKDDGKDKEINLIN